MVTKKIYVKLSLALEKIKNIFVPFYFKLHIKTPFEKFLEELDTEELSLQIYKLLEIYPEKERRGFLRSELEYSSFNLSNSAKEKIKNYLNTNSANNLSSKSIAAPEKEEVSFSIDLLEAGEIWKEEEQRAGYARHTINTDNISLISQPPAEEEPARSDLEMIYLTRF